MATNLNFDSISVDKSGRVSFSGLGTGIDLQKTVDSIIAARRIPIDRIEQRVEQRATRAAALQDLQSLSVTLRGAADRLKGAVSFDGAGDIFEAKQAFATSSRSDGTTPSSAADLVGVQVTHAAQATGHSLEVLQVAGAHKIASAGVAGTPGDALGASGTFTINGRTIAVGAGDDLLDLRDRINAANGGENATGVSASVVSLAEDDHVLILTADQTGTDRVISVLDTTGGVLQGLGVIDGAGTIQNELRAAANARFRVDGLSTTLERQGNTVDDVFTGVTLSLFKAEPGTTIEIDVEPDLNQVKQAIVDFVDAYNEVRAFINGQALTDVPDDDESGAGVLAGTGALSDVRARLSGAIGAAVDGKDPVFAVLAQIGITFEGAAQAADPLQVSTLTIDETRLDETLLNDIDAVRSLFALETTSSSADVVMVGFDRNVAYNASGYQLNVAMSGGVITSANLGGAGDGSDDGSVQIRGNALTVVEGPAKGLKLLYTGDAGASGIQLDVSIGIGAKTFHAVDALVDQVDGLFASEIKSLENQNGFAQTRIDRMEDLLGRERERLLERFAAMEAALASMNRLLESLKQQIDSAFGNNRG